jgi:undecaprenyl diphosphate synthase
MIKAHYVNYGGQQEIVDAVKKIVSSKVSSDDINKEVIEQALYAPQVPPVDLLIRTSGEHRISGFMLYRTTYSELYFIDKYWPDFNENDMDMAINEYTSRQRRFGK